MHFNHLCDMVIQLINSVESKMVINSCCSIIIDDHFVATVICVKIN